VYLIHERTDKEDPRPVPRNRFQRERVGHGVSGIKPLPSSAMVNTRSLPVFSRPTAISATVVFVAVEDGLTQQPRGRHGPRGTAGPRPGLRPQPAFRPPLPPRRRFPCRDQAETQPSFLGSLTGSYPLPATDRGIKLSAAHRPCWHFSWLMRNRVKLCCFKWMNGSSRRQHKIVDDCAGERSFGVPG